MLPVLTTPRLVLRPAAAADTDAVWRLLVQPAVRRYLCDDITLPRAAVAAMVEEDGACAAGMGLWIAESAAGFAGIAALKPVAPVLVALLPELWHRGLASEMLGAVLAHGFATLALPRIVAVCDAPNFASATMLARAGFIATGEHQGVAYRIRTWTLARPG